MFAETKAWWQTVTGYARDVCENVLGFKTPTPPRSQPNTASLLIFTCVFLV